MRQCDIPMIDGDSSVRIVDQIEMAIEVCVIREACEMSDGSDAKYAFDLASDHYAQSDTACEQSGFAGPSKPSALEELDIDRVGAVAQPKNVGWTDTIFVCDHRNRGRAVNRRECIQAAGRGRLLEQFYIQTLQVMRSDDSAVWSPATIGIHP